MNFKNGSNGSTGEGNTILPPSRTNPSKKWCFTYFCKDTDDFGSFEKVCKDLGKWYIVGLETCPTTGKKHWQGYIEFKEKCRPIEKMKSFLPNAHWEKNRGSQEENFKYCSKEKFFFSNIRILEDPLNGIVLYTWQTKILDIIKERADDRTIHWFWEPNGKTGKTTLAKHICMNYNAVFLQGKSNDIKCGVAAYIKENKSLDIAIFYYPRTYEDYVSYEALESIKDGIFFNGKYESGMCMYNSPHVLIFANFEPNKDSLSKDRWNIVRIPKQTMLDLT